MLKATITIEYEFKLNAYTSGVECAIKTPKDAADLDLALLEDEGLSVFLSWMEDSGIHYEIKPVSVEAVNG